MKAAAALILGSAVGGVARYLLGGAVQRVLPAFFPFGTLAVNSAGCLIIGFLSAAGGTRLNLGHQAQLLLVTGFCGAFTTFSAVILETDAIYRGGHPGVAAGYLAVTIVLGFIFFLAGAAAGRLL